MKKYLLLILFFTAYKSVTAQKDTAIAKNWPVYDVLPQYPGGLDAFKSFLAANVNYPAAAHLNRVHGRVIVSFTVEKDGSLADIYVARGIGYGCDEEALRVMRLSPKWKPGTRNGQPVNVTYSVPINFVAK